MKAQGQSQMTRLFAERNSPSAAAKIVRILSAQGSVTASEISRQTGLARSTVSTALSELRDSGIVLEFESQTPERRIAGRPVKRVSLNPETGVAVGLHLGLETISLAVIDLAHNVIGRQDIYLGRDYSPEVAIEASLDELTSLFARQNRSADSLLGIGVSVSGPVSPDRQVLRSSILPQWAGANISELLAPNFRRPVSVENEANCAAIAEMTWGAARGHSNFLMMRMGLGVGGAIVENGRLWTGIAGGAGEFGHIGLVRDGELCRCGNRGCLETVASFAGPLEKLNARRKTAIDINTAIDMAKAGDPEIIGMIREVADNAGWGLAVLCTAMNPPLVLISGLLAQAGDLLMDPLTEAYERHIMIKPKELRPEHRTRVLRGSFLTDDSLRGAAGLVLHSIDSIIRQRAG